MSLTLSVQNNELIIVSNITRSLINTKIWEAKKRSGWYELFNTNGIEKRYQFERIAVNFRNH